jgi:hypothetical protein
MSNFESDSGRVPKQVVVGNAPQPLDATLLQMELEAHGISSIQDGEYTVAVDPLLSNAIGGVRVMVDESDEEAAREVLSEFYRKRREDETAQEFICPVCKADDALPVERSFVFWLLMALSLGVLALLPWARYECGKCGHRWR